MRYPKFLKEGDTIFYVAPSFGVSGYPYAVQYEDAKKKFMDFGYHIKEAASLYNLDFSLLASNTPEIRAKELMESYLNPDFDFVHSVAGGEVMMDILPYLNFHTLIHAEPKWYMGYSDNTNFVFLNTILCDTASLYGANVENFGMENWHSSLKEAYEIMCGKRLCQKNYDKFCIDDLSHEENMALCDYQLTEDSQIRTLSKTKEVFSGRMIGGCLDCLQILVGTPYDQVEEFKVRYSEDGVIFFLEACDLNPASVYRALWQMRQAGWFDEINGVIFGREKNREDYMGFSFENAVEKALGDLNIPIVLQADFGHVPPSWTIISGAIATIEAEEKSCTISYELK